MQQHAALAQHVIHYARHPGQTRSRLAGHLAWALQSGPSYTQRSSPAGFVERQQDLVITGKPGTGKSHILMSIALRACEAGHLVRYARFVDRSR